MSQSPAQHRPAPRRRIVWTAVRAGLGLLLAGVIFWKLTHPGTNGIGLELTADGNYVVAGQVDADGPAAAVDGLRPGDRILAVAEAEGAFTELTGLTPAEVRKRGLLRGRKRTLLRLRLADGDGRNERVVTVRREDKLAAALQGADLRLLALTLAVYVVIILLTFRRWQKLLEVQDVHLPFATVTRLGMIGLFFNPFLPGAVSGDFIKMAYIAQHTPGRRTEAAMTVMLDRVLGLFGLFIVAGVACLMCLRLLQQAPRVLQLAASFVGLSSVAGITGMLDRKSVV